jgi:hypothetical protein
MKNNLTEISLGKAAIIAGFSLLLMTIFAVLAEFFVRQGLIVPGDAIATVSNIMANDLFFRFDILSFIIVVILDVIVSWALYIVFKPVNKSVSLLAAWFRLVYSALFGVAVVHLLNVLPLVSGSEYLKVFEPGQLAAQVMLSLRAFDLVWNTGLIFFGIHLILIGYLTFKSGYIPKILGVLLVIAGLGYATDSIILFLVPGYEPVISLVTFIGEALLMVWLLIKGFRLPDQNSENILPLPSINN